MPYNITKSCGWCNGTGYVNTIGYDACFPCGGRGVDLIGTTCERCNGTGGKSYTRRGRCNRCG